MQPLAGKATAPSDDRRWKLVDATMRKHGKGPSTLIESLHTVQEFFGDGRTALRLELRSRDRELLDQVRSN